MIEELLKTFVGVIDAQLLETIELTRIKDRSELVTGSVGGETYLEDFEASDIEDTDEVLSFGFDVECHVDTLDQPKKHTIVDLRDASLTTRFTLLTH